MRRALLGSLLLSAVVGAGCDTAAGNYFANRARDFGECFRVEVGVGVGFGAGARALGIADTGIGVGNWYRLGTVGWAYGAYLPQATPPGVQWNREVGAVCWVGTGRIRPVPDRDPSYVSRGDEETEYMLFGFSILPALSMGRVYGDGHGNLVDGWIWSPPPKLPEGAAPPPDWWTDARLHAFDIEAWAFLGCVGARAGFSPGEFLDFVLGWFGVDIAGDDSPWPAGER